MGPTQRQWSVRCHALFAVPVTIVTSARFVGNPHIIAATQWDYSLQPAHARATFPEPLPPYLPRTVKVPSANPPILDPNSANAGRFSLSLKGMRRELRKSGFRAEVLVRDIEYEIVDWLQGGTVLSPDSHDANVLESTGTLLGDTRTIFELSRSPLQLIWSIADDAFARYVVHCCARYHEVVSYSKPLSPIYYPPPLIDTLNQAKKNPVGVSHTSSGPM